MKGRKQVVPRILSSSNGDGDFILLVPELYYIISILPVV